MKQMEGSHKQQWILCGRLSTILNISVTYESLRSYTDRLYYIHRKLKESDDVTNINVYFNIYFRDM